MLGDHRDVISVRAGEKQRGTLHSSAAGTGFILGLVTLRDQASQCPKRQRFITNNEPKNKPELLQEKDVVGIKVLTYCGLIEKIKVPSTADDNIRNLHKRTSQLKRWPQHTNRHTISG